jgi:hypothetical protein
MEGFADLIEKCLATLQERNERNCRDWGMDRAARWNLDVDRRQLLFTLPGGARVSASPQIIGSLDTQRRQWRWAWANQSVDAPLREHAEKLREFGEQHDFPALTQPAWPATEQDGWNMTALALHLYDAEGAYRAPAGRLHVFLTFDDVKRLSD